MSRRNIIVLVVCTLILMVVSISTVRKEPAISGAFLSLNKDLSRDEVETGDEYYYFNDLKPDIFLILSVEDLYTGDRINIKWSMIENGTGEVVQENTIYPDQEGSGEIVISFIKRNESYAPGMYSVDVFLNSEIGLSRQFLLSDGE